MMNNNIAYTKSVDLSLRIISLYKKLVANNEYIISKQLLRSATSIGANISESIAGSSKKDFLNKLCIALKEAHETLYWLEILQKSETTTVDLHNEIEITLELIKILSKSTKTTKEQLSTSY